MVVRYYTSHIADMRHNTDIIHSDGQLREGFSFLGKVDWTMFTALEEVQALCCKWPLDE